MSSETTPSLYDIYSFFHSLRTSLPDYNDFSDLVGTLFIPHDVMPVSETLANVLPYFRRCSNPSLFTTFQIMMRHAEQNASFESTFLRVCDAMDILEKIEYALGGNRRLLEGYLHALQLDNASASHEQVMNSLQRFLTEKCDANTQLRVRKVFAEEGAADELGLSGGILAIASAIIDDDALYIQILQTLQLNHRQNLSWEAVISRIQKIVQEKKPAVWSEFYAFLDSLHTGNIYDYNSDKLAKVRLDNDEDNVDKEQQPQQREIGAF
ncbi:10120_t:CDS:2 [Paraglomus occultum]|uniref:10120_t:CDS:1 n=1 Tax=Paraglomus occultum TaxID=144539 RepID=A0A9N9FWW0_9GLOM|nr:10120_t:CDS:2 [Paraglomus occultum]